MGKGMIVMIAVGLGFLYLVFNMVDQAESTTPGMESGQSRKAKEHAMYYSQDINGDDVLNLAGVPLAKAKEIWRESTVKDRILAHFPDFDTMKSLIQGQLGESEFKTLLLKKTKTIERDYIDGSISLDQAKKVFTNLK